MKNKFIFLLLLLSVFVGILVSCSDFKRFFTDENYDYVFEEDTDDSLLDLNTEHEQGNTYVVNINTKTYHYAHCTYAKNLAENNKDYFYDKEFLDQRGYKACKKCIN